MRSVFSLMLAWMTSGCVAWVMPPVAVSGGVRSDESFAMSAGLHPLQAVKELTDRRVDLGAGYEFAEQIDGDTSHGAYLEGAYLSPQMAEDDLALRFGVATRARIFVEERQLGGGGALRLLAEVSSFISGSDATCGVPQCHAVTTKGEAAAGVFLEAGSFWRGGEHELAVTGGLILRLPMSAGGIFYPLAIVHALLR